MQKFLGLCLLAICVGLVLSAPQLDRKRFIEALGFDVESLFDLDTLYCDVQIILDVVGSDPTEQACESECIKVLQEGTTLVFGCPLICHALQDLANFFHEEPEPGQANATCGGAELLESLGKRR